MKSKRFFSLVVAIFSSFTYGQINCPVKSDVYYINGVDSPDEQNIRDVSTKLNVKLRTFSKSYQDILKTTYLYNDSDGIFLDTMWEFSAQKAVERNLAITDAFVSFGMAALGYVSAVSDADQIAVRQKVAGIINRDLPAKTLALLDQFSTRVKSDSLNNGVQAILVPHSQGNMFANAVYSSLSLSEAPSRFRGLGVVNVASPAHTAPSGLYLTLKQDLVISDLAVLGSLGSATLTPLPYNFDAPGANEVDGLGFGHNFLNVYLSETIPRGTVPANSVAAVLVGKIDTALHKTSTFYDSPSWIFDAYGNKVPKPVGADDSSVAQVCFPEPVGGLF